MSKQTQSPLEKKFFDDAGKLVKFVNDNQVEVVAITQPHNFEYILFYREKC